MSNSTQAIINSYLAKGGKITQCPSVDHVNSETSKPNGKKAVIRGHAFEQYCDAKQRDAEMGGSKLDK